MPMLCCQQEIMLFKHLVLQAEKIEIQRVGFLLRMITLQSNHKAGMETLSI